MQVWVVALSPATELTDLEAIAVLCRLTAGATALTDEPLDQQGIAPHDGSQEIWAFYEDSLMRHCNLFLKRTKAWHKTREW